MKSTMRHALSNIIHKRFMHFCQNIILRVLNSMCANVWALIGKGQASRESALAINRVVLNNTLWRSMRGEDIMDEVTLLQNEPNARCRYTYESGFGVLTHCTSFPLARAYSILFGSELTISSPVKKVIQAIIVEEHKWMRSKWRNTMGKHK